MADNGPPPPGMAFPQKIRSENEEYIVDLEENMHNAPDNYGIDDRGRCKRRKRCGQCGPCQVKENCMKCHFCVRKDVLKQTCIYRKCVYLRSKPKPYSRPHQSPQAPGRMSPSREVSQPSPAVKSPAGIVSPGLPYGEQGMGEPRPDNPFFTSQLPQPPQSQQLATLQNNGYTSPVPVGDRNQPLSGAIGSSTMNMNMQVNNMNHHMQNNTASSPLHKLGEQASNPLGLPQPVNSQPAAVPGIPQITSCGNIPSIPAIPPVVPSMPSVIPPVSSNAIPGIPPIPSIPSMPGMNDRPINDFRSPEQLGLHPHHPHHHFPAVPPVHPHPHMPHREANFFGDPSRVPHMNFTAPNHMDSFSRGPNDSSCMYHPSLPYSMPGHLQPSGPSFLSGAAEMNPFRSNFLNSFPPGYSYPPDRYREGFGTLPFSRLGMSSSAAFPQYPGQGAGYGMGNSFSNQYSPYNSQHGCPKNGSCPPVSPLTDDVKVLQEGYKKYNNKLNDKVDVDKSENLDDSGLGESDMSVSDKISIWEELGYRSSPLAPDMSPGSDIARLWNCSTPKYVERSNSVSSVSSRSSLWEPWRSPSWFNTRLDDVRSRACSSRVSSDFECEVISVDDHQLNARIKSYGGNSIEIDFDDSSVCGSELDMSPEKSFTQINSKSQVKQALFIGEDGKLPESDHEKKQDGKKTRKHQIGYLKEPVCIMQDLGEEGTIQLQLPGNKVSIQNIILDDKWLSKSNNTEELKKYIRNQL